MRNFSLSKLQYLLLALLLTALAGCGTSNTASSSNTGSGKLAAKLVWGDGNAKTTAKTVAAIPVGIDTIRMTVTGTSDAGTASPVVRKDIVVTPSTTSGTIDGIQPGKVTLAVQALTAGAVQYEGYYIGAVVKSGATTDLGTILMNAPVVKVNDASCASCHETTLDVTGQNLIADYKQSGHYTNPATGCAACHGTQHNSLNPSADGKCFDCHGGVLSPRHTSATALVAGDANPARYMSIGGTNCSACHEPHNPFNGVGKKEREEWAASAHGDVNGLAWTHYDFTGPGRGGCAACHTPEGFKRAMADGWVATTDLSATSLGKKPMNCDACHSDNAFNLRTLSAGTSQTTGGYVAKYGGFGATPKATAVFSNQGESNLCIPCHAGRENGDSLKAGNGTIAAPVSYNFTNKSFVNPHYLVSAGVWQGTAGFKYYSSTDWYHVNKPFHGVPTADLKLPLREEIVDSNISGAFAKGACVACHMGAKADHKWDVFEAVKFKSYSSTVAYTGCLGCHSNTLNGFQRYYPTNATQPSRVASGGYVQQRALAMLRWELEQRGIFYNAAANPYFFKNNTGTATADQVTNWTTQVVGDTDPVANNRGLRTMGAAMNLKTLLEDKGAAAHNSYLTRHLIADSLIYLQKGAVLADRTAFVSDLGQLISFTAYSTAVTPSAGAAPNDLPGNPSTIANLKQFLTTWTTNSTATTFRLRQ